jgi:hypothetical protein
MDYYHDSDEYTSDHSIEDYEEPEEQPEEFDEPED